MKTAKKTGKIEKIKLSDKKSLFSLISDSPAVIGLCGQMAAGKNFVAEALCSCSPEKCVSIDLDSTVHAAIRCLEPQILEAFSADAKKAGLVLQNEDGSITVPPVLVPFCGFDKIGPKTAVKDPVYHPAKK